MKNSERPLINCANARYGKTFADYLFDHLKQESNMKVTLIDYTGRGNDDPLYAARLLIYTKETRLTQGEDTRAKVAALSEGDVMAALPFIANTIRSSWEFVDYTFEITGVTRAFTHQLVRTRTASYAQQAQRVVDMSDFDALVPPTILATTEFEAIWDHAIDAIRDGYDLLHKAGVPAQDCRGLLPTNVFTNIIMKANLRTMADLLPKRKSLRAQGEYNAVASAMEEAMLAVHPWAKPFLSPDRAETPNLDRILRELLGSEGPTGKPIVNAALKELDTLKGTWG